MHSVHQSVIRRHNNGTAANHNLQHSQDHISAHDQQQQQQQQQQDKQNNHQHDLSSMTVLETLEPVQGAIEPQQPVLSTLDPVQEQPPIIHHHLVASPRLHGLHPASQHEDQDERHQQQQQQHELSESARRQQQHQQRQKPMAQLMAEGIVAEGGGPIVQWLLDNYEIAEGESLPRSTVYNHYLAHCKQLRISSVNAASFGKLIRSVFLGLKTRRLGTRGHSKYHYFGVQAKAHVRLAWLSQGVGSNGQAMGPGCSSNLLNDNSNNGTDGSESDSTGDGGRSSSMMSDSNKRLRRSTNNDNESSAVYAHHQNYHRSDSSSHQNFMQANYTTEHHDQNQSQHQQQSQASNGMYYSGGHGAPPSAPLAQATNGYDKHSGGEAANAAIASDAPYYVQVPRYDHYDLSSFRNHLGANKASLVDEHWPERDGQLLERAQQQSSRTRAETNKSAANNNNHLHVTSGLVDTFESQYKSYYKRMVEFLGELQFGEIEHLTMDFWHPVPMPAAHETIHWTSTTTSAVSTPSGPCDIVVASSPAANTNGAHHMSYADQQRQQDALHHQLLQQQQQEHQMMYQNMNSLTVDQLYQLTSNPAMIDRINQIDCRLYSAIESYLVVDMLQPLPRPLVHHLRLFARNICSWIEQAVKEYRTEFINEKMKSTRAFEQALRRSTSVNHLATASRSIWSKRAVLHQMGSDLSRLDLHDIELQVAALMTSQENSSATSSSLVHLDSDDSHHHHQQHTTTTHNGCEPMQQADRPNDNNSTKRTYPSSQSDDNIENHYRESNSHGHNTGSLSAPGCGRSDDICVSLQPGQLIQNLIHLLEDPYPAEAWPNWCQTLVESRVCGQSFEEARSFILKWNFYISLVSRELTLRSAPSLGSFQLIRLLFDEYMFYLVVKRLAQVQHKTPTQLLRPSVRYENI